MDAGRQGVNARVIASGPIEVEDQISNHWLLKWTHLFTSILDFHGVQMNFVWKSVSVSKQIKDVLKSISVRL